jgi:hypothetical protein
MTPEIEHWLTPMLDALLMDKRGGEAFAHFMERAIASASDRQPVGIPTAELASPSALAEMFGPSTDRRIGTVDWVRLGQLIRVELAWDDYPAVPPRRG